MSASVVVDLDEGEEEVTAQEPLPPESDSSSAPNEAPLPLSGEYRRPSSTARRSIRFEDVPGASSSSSSSPSASASASGSGSGSPLPPPDGTAGDSPPESDVAGSAQTSSEASMGPSQLQEVRDKSTPSEFEEQNLVPRLKDPEEALSIASSGSLTPRLDEDEEAVVVVVGVIEPPAPADDGASPVDPTNSPDEQNRSESKVGDKLMKETKLSKRLSLVDRKAKKERRKSAFAKEDSGSNKEPKKFGNEKDMLGSKAARKPSIREERRKSSTEAAAQMKQEKRRSLIEQIREEKRKSMVEAGQAKEERRKSISENGQLKEERRKSSSDGVQLKKTSEKDAMGRSMVREQGAKRGSKDLGQSAQDLPIKKQQPNPIESSAMVENVNLTSTLLAGNNGEPLRDELQNWLSSAIDRVEQNLSWGGEPALRTKDHSNTSIFTRAPAAPRKTPVNQTSHFSSSFSEDIDPSPSTPTSKLDDLWDEIGHEESGEPSRTAEPSPLPIDLQEWSPLGTARQVRIAHTEEEDEKGQPKSRWTRETSEEGLQRLQREVEQRASASRAAKKPPRLSLPEHIRKKRRPAESVASDFLRSELFHPSLKLTLNKELLCRMGGTDDPQNLKTVGLSGLNISYVEESDLMQFENLRSVDLSVNQLNMEDLSSLGRVRKLSLQCNQLQMLRIFPGSFEQLQALDLSYNTLDSAAILVLSALPSLETLNMDHNSIREIHEEVGEPWSFPRLKVFSAASNHLKSSSLVPLSKVLRLEKLLLSHNSIQRIPEQIKYDVYAFRRLELLDLTYNKISDSHKLTPLLNNRSLKQILLWETPLARKLVCDGEKRLLDVAKPVLQHILQAQQAGQNWITEEPQSPPIELEHVQHFIQQFVPPEIKLFDRRVADEMARAFELTNEIVRSELGDKHCGVHRGYVSTTLPFTDDIETPAISACEAPSEISASDISPSIDEAMQQVQINEHLTENHLSDANAAVVSLRNALRIPLREVDFSPAHYLTMTKTGRIRVNEQRFGVQDPFSPRKNAVHLARKFVHKAEVEAESQVPSVLERMQRHLAVLDGFVKETLVRPEPYVPRRVSVVNDYADSDGTTTFRES